MWMFGANPVEMGSEKRESEGERERGGETHTSRSCLIFARKDNFAFDQFCGERLKCRTERTRD